MPAGVAAVVDEGFATLDFVDKTLRGPALTRLLKIGGPRSIEVLTREGPRKQYRVPEGNAREAGLVDPLPAPVKRPIGRPRKTPAPRDNSVSTVLAESD